MHLFPEDSLIVKSYANIVSKYCPRKYILKHSTRKGRLWSFYMKSNIIWPHIIQFKIADINDSSKGQRNLIAHSVCNWSRNSVSKQNDSVHSECLIIRFTLDIYSAELDRDIVKHPMGNKKRRCLCFIAGIGYSGQIAECDVNY